MSRYGNDLAQRRRMRERSDVEQRQRQAIERMNKKRSEQAEQELNARILALREQIDTVEDLSIKLQKNNLLVFADLTRLKERERSLIVRLYNLSSDDLNNNVLQNEIAEFRRMYNEFALGFNEQSPQAQATLTKKKNQLREGLYIATHVISILFRTIEELLSSPEVEHWFKKTLVRHATQLREFVNLLQKVSYEPSALQESLEILDKVRSEANVIQEKCSTYRHRAIQLERLSREKAPTVSTDENEVRTEYLFQEPYYYHRPKYRIPPRILAKIQALEASDKETT